MTMTIAEALAFGRAELEPTDGRLLLQHVLDVSHSYLLAHDEEQLTAAQTERYRALVARGAAHEPIPYLIGSAPFYGRDFHVSPAVLIPRPETELLVDAALRWLRGRPACRIVDVGTGSGCIPITLALETVGHSITAVDISPEALAVAQGNAATLGAAINFVAGDLLSAVTPPVDLITANLPYISDDEWTELAVGVKSYEPALALRGGADGLDLIRPLLAQATTRLASPGLILLEIGWQQGAAACKVAQEAFPEAAVSLLRDYAGHNRLVRLETRG